MSLDIGFVGLGRMGAAMVSRLLALGHQVTVYNRTRAACAPLVAEGATAVDRPADVARDGGLVISTLASEQAVSDICEGDDGILGTLRGGTHLSMSTLSPQFAEAIAARHTHAGVSYISAPVQGRPPMAGNGQLIGWVSGPQPADAARVALEALCARQVLLGPDVRHACAAKLALNVLMFANVALLAEALAYVDSVGADGSAFADGLSASVFPGPFFKGVTGALLAADDTARGSDLQLCVKDFGLMLSGAGSPLRLPVCRQVESVYQRALSHGLGKLDPVAVRQVVGSAPLPSTT